MAACRSKGGRHDARRAGRAIWAWKLQASLRRFLRHILQQKLRQQRPVLLEMAARAALRKFATMQCEHQERAVHATAVSRQAQGLILVYCMQ